MDGRKSPGLVRSDAEHPTLACDEPAPFNLTLDGDSLIAYRKETAFPGCHLTSFGFRSGLPAYVFERKPEKWATLIFCVGGKGEIEMGARHSLSPGDLFAVPPGLRHETRCDPVRPWSNYWLHLEGSSVPLLLSRLGLGTTNPLLPIEGAAKLAARFEEIRACLRTGSSTAHLDHASTLGASLLTELQRRYGVPGRPVRKRVSFSVEPIVQKMTASLDGTLTLEDLAEVAGGGVAGLGRRFKAETGFSPMDYFIRLKMHAACELLVATDRSVQEVGESLGYADPFYFSRLFRKVIGLSPTDFRKSRGPRL